MLTIGSLFSGIGGLELGLEKAGLGPVKWQVENDEYCNKVLEKHWPGVKRYGDIKAIDWSEVEPVDLVCGGFPCQPVSVAGSQKGDKDERWLWPEFLRAVREIRPRYAVVENVPGLLSADGGRLARGVFGGLAEIRYDAEWGIVSAFDVGAPHLRERVFVIAYPEGDLRGASGNERSGASDGRGEVITDPDEPRRGKKSLSLIRSSDTAIFGNDGKEESLADPEGSERTGGGDPRSRRDGLADGCSVVPDPSRFGGRGWTLCGVGLEANAGLSGEGRFHHSIGEVRDASREWWAVEPGVGRVADGVPYRVDRLRCLGNAVVPQVAEAIGRMIANFENVRISSEKGNGSKPAEEHQETRDEASALTSIGTRKNTG